MDLDNLNQNLDKVPHALLAISEAAALVTQIIWPNNKGFSGILASLIKLLQGGKDS